MPESQRYSPAACMSLGAGGDHILSVSLEKLSWDRAGGKQGDSEDQQDTALFH